MVIKAAQKSIYIWATLAKTCFPKIAQSAHTGLLILSLSLSLSLIASFSVRLDKDLKTEPDVSNESNVSLGS